MVKKCQTIFKLISFLQYFIREYEQREIRIHEENEAKINTYKHDEERLQYELDFLKSEDRQCILFI